MANKKTIYDWPLLRLILTAVSTVLAVAILALSSLTIVNIYNDNVSTAPTFLIWIFVCLGLMSIVMFLRNRTKINLIKCLTLIIIDIALGIIVLFAKDNPFLFSLTAGLYCVTIVISRIFNIVQDRSIRNVVLNVLIIVFAIALGVGLLITNSEEMTDLQGVILVECIFIAFVSFIEAMSIALAQLKVKVLIKIIVSTFSLEVLFGLLIMIVTCSLVFVSIEPAIDSFPDGLWYCFAVVTTIGFGDIVAVTPVGRVLTVMLGLYGLVVVAVITSIIVNFYNETSGKHDQKELQEIKKEEEKRK